MDQHQGIAQREWIATYTNISEQMRMVSWYYRKSNDHHTGSLIEVTKEGEVVHHDIFLKNMKEGIVRTFKEAFPIFKDPESAEAGEQLLRDVIEELIQRIPGWPFPLPFPIFLPPDDPKIPIVEGPTISPLVPTPTISPAKPPR